MADPVLITITKGQWTKVANAVTTGQVWRKDSLPNYFMTIRDAGNPAPTVPDLLIEGVKVFTDTESMAISSSISIDVYLFVDGDKDGLVRVDL